MKFIGLILMIGMITACSSAANNDDKLKSENIALVEKYIQAVQSKDLKTMEDLLSDNYTVYGPAFSDSIN